MRVSVVGAESSGTRLMTRILQAAGAEAQHRSFPYGFPDSPDEVRRWPVREVEEFWPHAVVVMVRDWWATMESQVAAGYVRGSDEAWANLRSAYLRIGEMVAAIQVPWYVVTYAGLVQRPDVVVGWLCDELGLPVPDLDEEIVDGNAKYLGVTA